MNASQILEIAGFLHLATGVSPGVVRVELRLVDAATRASHFVACAYCADSDAAVDARALALLACAASTGISARGPARDVAARLSIAVTAAMLERRDPARFTVQPGRREAA